MNMYESVEGCNLEIDGYPFTVEKASPNEAYRRREINLNPLVGGTLKATKGQYIGLDFKITTHVRVDPNKPYVHGKIFQEMMSKPVTVVSPELSKDSFKAMVVITPEHSTLNFLELSISIKEIPSSKSKIPGESWTVPKTKKIDLKKKNKNNDSKTDTKKGKTSGKKGNSKRNTAGKKSKANTGKKK